jgi:hypothetical protein
VPRLALGGRECICRFIALRAVGVNQTQTKPHSAQRRHLISCLCPPTGRRTPATLASGEPNPSPASTPPLGSVDHHVFPSFRAPHHSHDRPFKLSVFAFESRFARDSIGPSSQPGRAQPMNDLGFLIIEQIKLFTPSFWEPPNDVRL